MLDEVCTAKLGQVIEFNPRESMQKGKSAKKIAMEKLEPFTKFITTYEIEEYKGGSKFRNGDTLLARITPCLENGKTSQVTILNDGEVGFGSTEFLVMRAIEGKTNKDYVYYLSISPEFRKIAVQSMVGSSGRQRVQIDLLKNLDYSIPPLPTQRKIAAILSSLDDKIENNRKTCEKLEEIAQAIFKRWFVEFEFPNEEGKPYKSSGGKMVDSETGMIPEGWSVGELKKVASLENKSTNPNKQPEKQWLHYSIPSYDQGKIPVTEEGQKIKSSKYVIPKNSVLVSKLNPRFPRIWIPNIIREESICSTEFMPFVPINKTDRYYIYLYFKSKDGQSKVLSRVTGSTGSRQRVKPSDICNMEVIIPLGNTRIEFFNVIKPQIQKMLMNIEENQILIKLRDALLPKLMSGELSVEDIGEVD